MIHATFRIQLPEDLWVTQVSREFPRATFRLLSGYRADDDALELGEAVTDSPAAVVEAMRAHPSIADYELLESDDRRVLAKYETSNTDLYEFVELSSLTIEFPIDVRNGWYEFDLTGTRDELDRLEAVLDELPLSYELLSLVRTTETDGLLTDRQREVLAAAIRNGYFEVPRECSLADVADDLAVDKSTVSTVLRNGESKIVKWFMTGTAGKRLE